MAAIRRILGREDSISSKSVHASARDSPACPKTHRAALSNETYRPPEHSSRFTFDPKFVPWNVTYPDYRPVEYTSSKVIENDKTKRSGGWADPPDFLAMKKEFLRRNSFCADDMKDLLGANGVPRNPVGRTGMTGRGLLGKWGPNLAADPIVTCCSPVTGFLYMVAIKRSDTQTWAIPGGMVDDNEMVSKTLMREFGEEATADASGDTKKALEEIFDKKNARVIFRGYVDDPRNTDNAWMETSVVHFHCAPHLAERINLSAGDDAVGAAWLCIEDENERFQKLYANHKEFIKQAVESFRNQKEKKAFGRK